MVKLVDKQNVFNKGIMTSKLWARDDLQQYTQGVADAENFVLSKYGPLTKRVGTDKVPFLCIWCLFGVYGCIKLLFVSISSRVTAAFLSSSSYA